MQISLQIHFLMIIPSFMMIIIIISVIIAGSIVSM